MHSPEFSVHLEILVSLFFDHSNAVTNIFTYKDYYNLEPVYPARIFIQNSA